MRFPDIHSTTFALFFTALMVLAIVHHVSLYFALYWSYPWLDIPMHTLGGAVVSLGFLSTGGIPERRSVVSNLLLVLLVVLAVGALWEIFEYTSGMTAGQPNLLTDTVGDVVMNIIGGTIGFFVAQRSTQLDELVYRGKDDERN